VGVGGWWGEVLGTTEVEPFVFGVLCPRDFFGGLWWLGFFWFGGVGFWGGGLG